MNRSEHQMSATATRSAPRVYKSHEWEEKRTAFEELYSQDKTLAQVMQLMGQNHNFYATEAQYKKKIKVWGLEKNIDKETALGILRKGNKRKYVEGKDTKFTYKGKELNKNRVDLLRKRHKGLDHEDLGSDPCRWEMVQADTPPYVSYSTPPCISHSPPAPVDEPPEVEYAITDHPPHDTQVTDNEGIPGGECIMDDFSLITDGRHTAGLGQDISARPVWDGLELEKVLDNETQHNDSAEAPPSQQLQSQGPFGRSPPMQPAEPQEPVEIQISSKGDDSSYFDSTLELEGNGTTRLLLPQYSKNSMMDRLWNSGEGFSLYQALMGDEEMVALLLKKGHDTSASNEYERTALLLVAELGHEDIIRLLLEGGIDISAETWVDKKTALHMAAEHGHEKVVQLLLKGGTDISAKDPRGKTALHLVAERGHEKIAQLLLTGGTDISAKDSYGETALHLAAERGYEKVAQLLLNGGIEISAKDPRGKTALHLVAERGHEKIVQLLLTGGTDISAKDFYEETALHLAAERGHEKVVQLLLEGGTDISAKGPYGKTALHLATERGHEGVVQLLLKGGIDISAKTLYSKQTALHLATGRGHEKLVQLLLKGGIDVSVKSSYGKTALHLAAESGHEGVAQLLLENGIDISAKDDSYGKTALHLAAERCHEGIVQLLLEHGIDVSARSVSGWTALQLVEYRSNSPLHWPVIQLLREAEHRTSMIPYRHSYIGSSPPVMAS